MRKVVEHRKPIYPTVASLQARHVNVGAARRHANVLGIQGRDAELLLLLLRLLLLLIPRGGRRCAQRVGHHGCRLHQVAAACGERRGGGKQPLLDAFDLGHHAAQHGLVDLSGRQACHARVRLEQAGQDAAVGLELRQPLRRRGEAGQRLQGAGHGLRVGAAVVEGAGRREDAPAGRAEDGLGRARLQDGDGGRGCGHGQRLLRGEGEGGLGAGEVGLLLGQRVAQAVDLRQLLQLLLVLQLRGGNGAGERGGLLLLLVHLSLLRLEVERWDAVRHLLLLHLQLLQLLKLLKLLLLLLELVQLRRHQLPLLLRLRALLRLPRRVDGGQRRRRRQVGGGERGDGVGLLRLLCRRRRGRCRRDVAAAVAAEEGCSDGGVQLFLVRVEGVVAEGHTAVHREGGVGGGRRRLRLRTLRGVGVGGVVEQSDYVVDREVL
eukprot:Rhum_TRINITY_DN14635_c1_g1::Rhum_TRINITY_DN14635_c1_g1_i1::g.105708::m.105708